MSKFKFEGFKLGQAIKAFDFQPRPGDGPGTGTYVVGVIEDVCRAGSQRFPYAHYAIRCTRDVVAGIDVPRSKEYCRIGQIVMVPMETSMDFSGRVEMAS